MRGSDGRSTDLAQTLTELAELANRLRRFRSWPGAPPPPGVDRLEVAGRLTTQLGTESGHAATTALGETAAGLAQAARHAGPALDARLLDHLDTLADLLEDLLGAVDGGAEPAPFLARVDWTRVRPDRPAPPPATVDAAPGPALLLVASDFRRTALADRFAAAGLPWETAAGPEEALARLARHPRPVWIVCDDQEPERHLGRLRRLLAGAGEHPPLVLLAPGDPRENLAARRGADHLWREPFDPADLPT